MQGRIEIHFEQFTDEPRRWWGDVFLMRAPFVQTWINSTATYTTAEEAWREAKRILRREVAAKELDQVVEQV